MPTKAFSWTFIVFIFGRLAAPAGGAEDADDEALPPGAVARLGAYRYRFQHGGTISCLAVSPDSKVVATGGPGHCRICLWARASGKKIHEFRAPWCNMSCFGFSPDGRALAAGCGPFVCYWDTATGKELRRDRFQKRHILFVHFSADGKTVFSGDESATVQQKDIATGRQLGEWGPWQGKEPRLGNGLAAEACSAFAMSADGNTIVWQIHSNGAIAEARAVAKHYFLRIRDLRGDGAVREVSGPPAAFGKLALAPNGQIAATGLGGIWLWDTTRGRLLRSLGRELANVRGLAFSPDGRTLVSRHGDANLRLWNVQTGQLLQTFAYPEEEGWTDTHPPTRPLAFTPDGKTLLMGTPSGLLMWDVKAARENRLSSGHRGPIRRLAFAADGRTLTTDDYRTSCRWDTTTWKETDCFERGRAAIAGEETLAVSADWQQFLTQSRDRTVLLRETATHKDLHRWRVGRQDLNYGLFAPDARSAIVGNRKGTTFAGSILDLAAGNVRARLILPAIVVGPVYSPDSALLAWAAADQTVHLVNALTGLEVRQLGEPGFSNGKRDGEVQLVFSTGGDYLAAQPGDLHYPIRIWHVPSGVELRSVHVPMQVASSASIAGLAISPDGRTLATGQHGETAIRLWEVASGQEFRRLEGHGDSVLALAFSASGATLVSGSRDGIALVWSLHLRRPKKTDVTARELSSSWEDLLGDAPKAVAAIHRLGDAPKQSVPFLKEHLRPIEMVTKERFQQLIGDLDSDEFSIREKASRELAQLGDRVEKDLRKVLAQRPSPEVRLRIRLLLQDQQANAHLRAAEQLRALRAVACLEQAATTEASSLLTSLSRGEADAPLTREAEAALQRLSKRR